MLEGLLRVEVSARRERYLSTMTRLTNLPFHRTLDDFKFSFQPSIDERKIRELAPRSFVAEANNLILLGAPRRRQDTPGSRAVPAGHRRRLHRLLHARQRHHGQAH